LLVKGLVNKYYGEHFHTDDYAQDVVARFSHFSAPALDSSIAMETVNVDVSDHKLPSAAVDELAPVLFANLFTSQLAMVRSVARKNAPNFDRNNLGQRLRVGVSNVSAFARNLNFLRNALEPANAVPVNDTFRRYLNSFISSSDNMRTTISFSDVHRLVAICNVASATHQALTLIGIRRFRQSVLNAFPKEIVRKIARLVICQARVSFAVPNVRWTLPVVTPKGMGAVEPLSDESTEQH